MDSSDMVYTMVAYVLHGGFAGLQLLLAIYLVCTGIRVFVRERDGRVSAALRVGAGLAIALPAVVGAPFAISLAGCIGALVLLLRQDQGWLRRGFATATVLLACFTIFEFEDPAALGVELFWTMQSLRAGHVEWQREADRQAPKVGDLAPDFSLEDPQGMTQVRLSDFRGARPVALMFGSYT